MGCSVYVVNTCSLCYQNSVNVISVCIQDNFCFFKEICRLNQIFENYNLYSYLLLCENCLMKLRIFSRCKELKFSPYSRMQDSSHQPDDTNCQCDSCIAKFGNLPLLAEVIENIESKSKLESQIDQPSTSGTASRKHMNCSHCGKSFTHKGDLNKHLRKHTGEQPFQCTICQRRFAHTSNLARHLRVHSGDKPFRCDKCSKCFSRKDKLLMHQKTKLCMKTAQRST